jgi:hypothetical protein
MAARTTAFDVNENAVEVTRRPQNNGAATDPAG